MNKHKKLYATITVLDFAVLALAALSVQNQIALKKIQGETKQLAQKTEISQEYVLERLSKEESLAGKEPYSIQKITNEELKQQIEKYPAIYEENMAGMFDVKYENRWIIYDAANEKIIKDIYMQGMMIK